MVMCDILSNVNKNTSRVTIVDIDSNEHELYANINDLTMCDNQPYLYIDVIHTDPIYNMAYIGYNQFNRLSSKYWVSLKQIK